MSFLLSYFTLPYYFLSLIHHWTFFLFLTQENMNRRQQSYQQPLPRLHLPGRAVHLVKGEKGKTSYKWCIFSWLLRLLASVRLSRSRLTILSSLLSSPLNRLTTEILLIRFVLLPCPALTDSSVCSYFRVPGADRQSLYGFRSLPGQIPSGSDELMGQLEMRRLSLHSTALHRISLHCTV